ncbi:MAG: flagellar motor switch protein FliG [Chloroflexi bacterium]|nr:MAG: flagellar motor switch protein FliG [Chloroflexota bacterium]MBL1194842.1 flagellar motor switch protein FliG [Chloroflexota bacterium]NOH12133.1 flagellar motor switch protein FliG [Chloroflexota bacterium]
MSEMLTTNQISGVAKAASLLLNLDVQQSSKVLQYLGESDLERVMFAITDAKTLPPEARREALAEAYVFTSNSVGHSGGIEFTRQLLAQSIGPRRGADILERITARQQLSSFEILRNAEPARIAELLAEELPQTVALVLSYLDAKQAAEIITHMPQDMQIAITLKLSGMERVSPQVVQDVEQSLKHKLSSVISQADFKSTGGVEFLVKMLNQVDRGVQKSIMDALDEDNPSLVEEIRENMFTFDDLTQFDDRTMQRILRDVNKSDLALALKGASENLRELVYRNMSERARENLQEEVELLGPQLAKNVYAAQRVIVETVQKLEEDEEIMISGGAGGEDIIE